jgi:hypothetical protein
MCTVTVGASAQTGSEQPPNQDPHMNMPMGGGETGWHFMYDGVVFGLFNHQGGPRGGDEFKVPNWGMAMASRPLGAGQLTLTGMLSLDPATVGKSGYRELLQVGEASDGRPLIDRQHPHDFVMQLAAIWRTPLTDSTGLTIAGGPAGEPALGPVAFMHRASAAEMPFAPLSHHTFDSTHIAYGVITAAVDRGPWTLEGSVFNGREPDEHRWDFDFGPLDSVSGRLWYRPSARWELQLSTGHLTHPEELEPGNIQRTTMSASWFARGDPDFTAVTAGFGINATDDAKRRALFVEGTRRARQYSLFGRVEAVEVETNLLLTAGIPLTRDAAARQDTVGAFTLGATRHFDGAVRGIDAAVGGALTFYAVPDPLKVSHGAHPVSFQLFLRLRPAVPRMSNMRMSQPMPGNAMND